MLPGPEDIAAAVRRHAQDAPERRAFVFVADPATDDGQELSYAELDRSARRVGRWLDERGLAGEPVVLLHPPGLEFVRDVLGCLYAGALAVPAPAPTGTGEQQRRVAGILADSAARAVLTTAAARGPVESWLRAGPGEQVACVATDAADLGEPGDWLPRTVGPDEPALLQYTSGSTSEPRGVLVTRANLVHNARNIERALDVGTAVVGGWLPFHHDLGLMGQVLQPMYTGATGVLMSPLAFLKRPVRWLQLIDRFGLEVSAAPDFGYELCARRVRDDQVAGLDLSRWRIAVSGAEPVRAGTLAAFAARFRPAGFRTEAFLPCYGLAEATLLVCADDARRRPVVRRVDAGQLERGRLTPARGGVPARTLVSSGRPGEPEVRVVDPDSLAVLPAGRVGEIWVRGASVAGGYWRDPAATGSTFGAVTAAGERGFLRTGDLGVLADGELYVTGRVKDLLVVHGRNLYPQDIEHEVRSVHRALADGAGAAFAVPADDDGTEAVVLVQEVRDRGLDGTELREIALAVERHVGREFGVGLAQVLLVRPGSVGRTTSGKVQRSATRLRYAAGGLDPLYRHSARPAGRPSREPTR